MKIKINEHEFFEIEIPQEISIQELSIIIDRLYKVVKVFGNEVVLNKTINLTQTSGSSLHNKKSEYLNKTANSFSREQAIDIVKICCDKSLSDKDKANLIKQKYNRAFSSMKAILKYLRINHNIQPHEVNLEKFRTKNG